MESQRRKSKLIIVSLYFIPYKFLKACIMQKWNCGMKQLLILSFVVINGATAYAAPGTSPSLHDSTAVASTAVVNHAHVVNALNVSPYSPVAVRDFNELLPTDFFTVQEVDDLNDVAEPASPEVEELVKYAENLFDDVKLRKKYVKYLDQAALLNLPVGLIGEGEDGYTVIIDSIVMTPTYAYLSAFMSIPIPQSDQRLTFHATNIRFTYKGGLTGDAKLVLLKDVGVDLFGKNAKLVIKANQTTAQWDCSGFKNMSLGAEVFFSRSFLLPADEKKGSSGGTQAGGTQPAKQVTGRFAVSTTSWKDVVAQIDMDPFQVPSLKNFIFTVRNAVFDFSDVKNAATVRFPAGYTSPQLMAGNLNLWQGFYLQEVTVTLPREFAREKDTVRTSFAGYNIIIDNTGFSGMLEAKNLIPIEYGDMSGWDFSLDSIAIKFLQGDLQAAGFEGKIVVPVAKKEKPFDYKAIINPADKSYLFNITTAERLEFELWKAQVKLEKGSYLDINVLNGKFKPKAVLTGRMDIISKGNTDDSGNSTSSNTSLFDITFEELTISTEAPYLDAKAFSFGSDKLQNIMHDYPVSFSRIGLIKKADDRRALTFTVMVHLTGSEGKTNFQGDASFEIYAKREPIDQKWKFDGIRVSEVGIDLTGSGYAIKGRIKMFEQDIIYGKGFNGTAEIKIKPEFLLTGTVIFGKVDGYRYFYADAFVGLPQGIPFLGFFSFYGFGGGIYHNMEQVGFSQSQELSPGKSLSGVIYKPNKEVKFGIKATLQIGLTGKKDTFNGDVTFEMSFNRSGGIRRISLLGNGYLFETAPDFGNLNAVAEQVGSMVEHEAQYGYKESEDDRMTSDLRPQNRRDAMISGHIFQYFDFENGVIHGEMEMYIDIFNVIKGIGPNGMAGWSVIHYSEDEWYIYIGTPTRRVGLSILGFIRTDGYFMLGDNIDGSPALPARLTAILGDINLNEMRDVSALSRGDGVAFGSSFELDTGDMTFLMFYARFAMGAGFDFMLKKFGEDVRCKGSTKQIGINGWFAMGQTYAFVEGSIGIKFKLFGKRKKKEILYIGAAVVFQSKMPNPIWMKGIVGGRFRILGGLIKGHCKFEVEIGQKCQIVDGSIVETLTVISDITPAPHASEVDVFTTAQALFNLPVEKEFELKDVDDLVKSFRVKLEHFKVMDGENALPATLAWNSEKDVIACENLDIFPPEKELRVEVVISFEEKVNGAWKAVELNGKKVTEKKESTFTTGTAPDHIPASNVAYSYPQVDQFNFYRDEYDKGYIRLKKGQPYLFQLSGDWVQTGRFVAGDGNSIRTNFSYADRQVNFSIPRNLTNKTVYAFELVSLPTNAAGDIDRNVSEVSTRLEPGNESVDLEMTSRTAEGTIITLTEQLVYQSYFRTSAFNTFNAKFNSIIDTEAWIFPDASMMGVFDLGLTFRGTDLFDKAEISGINGMPSLVQLNANLAGNSWYEKEIYPLIYEGYPFLPGMKIYRREEALGIPPIYATYLKQDFNDRVTSIDDFRNQGVINGATIGKISYELDHYMRLDYADIESFAALWHAANFRNTTDRVRYILTNTYPVIKKIDHKVELRYVLPGTNIVTTSRTITIRPK